MPTVLGEIGFWSANGYPHLRFHDGMGVMAARFSSNAGWYLGAGNVVRWMAPEGNHIAIGSDNGIAYYIPSWPAITDWQSFPIGGWLGELRIRPSVIFSGQTYRGSLWAWLNLYNGATYVGDGWCVHPDVYVLS